jgi:riboflavin kinase/FMN adenylyltransferase
MQILTDLAQVKPEPSCLTIGFFDGVHRGHRYLISQATKTARQQGLRAVLLTFYPHPNVVLRGAEPFYLSTREEKLALLSELDLDLIVIQPFTPGLTQTRARQFIDWLIKGVGLVNLWVGPDFTMGYRREGNIPFLQRAGNERSFKVNIVEQLRLDGKPISSSRIRRALQEGDVTLAARCLGRPYCLQGPVVIGAQRGRTIGIPTANVEVPAERAVPAHGVYAAWARLCNERHRAVVNIGTRPTFDGGLCTIEAHLLDFNRDIYGQQLKIDFIARLRTEQPFKNAKALVKQINRDIEQARQLLHTPNQE